MQPSISQNQKNRFIAPTTQLSTGIWLILFFLPLIPTAIDKINTPSATSLFPSRDILLGKVTLVCSIIVVLIALALTIYGFKQVNNLRKTGTFKFTQLLAGAGIGLAFAIGAYVVVYILIALITLLIRNT